MTLNEQLAAELRASVAWQVTRVVPTGNGVPEGAQEIVNGSTPPLVVGAGTWIDTGVPVNDCPRMSAGHCKAKGWMTGPVGVVGASSPQAT